MDLSVIIISYNTRVLTCKAIDTVLYSLKKVSFKYEIVVFDNNSSDGSAEDLKKHYGTKIVLINSSENIGFGKGNNRAAKTARGNYLLFLNSDIEVLDEAIDKLYRFYLKHENEFQFVGGKLLNTDKTPQPSVGPFYSLPIVFAALFLRGDYWGLTRQSPDTARKVDWVSGACFITKKEYYEKTGGFDEQIFMYMEEIDLFYRARGLGYRVGFYPGAVFIHVGSASSGNRKNPILNVFKGFVYFYRKHHSRLQNGILILLLKTKALIGYTIGIVFHNNYLKETYGEASRLV